jgi:hypothetical protein
MAEAGLTNGESKRPGSFSRFIAQKIDPEKNRLGKLEYQAAVKGVLGMMRFAYHESPILLEVLGDLLAGVEGGYDATTDAKRLAARAYLRASSESQKEKARQTYRELAKVILQLQTKSEESEATLPLEDLEKDFQGELAEASRWYADLKNRELGWIRDGLNPEEEFDKLYTEEPRVSGEIADSDAHPHFQWLNRLEQRLLAFAIGGGALGMIVIIFAWRRLRHWLHGPINTPPAS